MTCIVPKKKKKYPIFGMEYKTILNIIYKAIKLLRFKNMATVHSRFWATINISVVRRRTETKFEAYMHLGIPYNATKFSFALY